MKLVRTAGSTSQIVHVFIQDSTVTTGAGKTALAFGDITAYYVRSGGTLTALTTETISTLGTWASTGDNYLGVKLLHDTNVAGLYELHLPNNILAAGASSVVLYLRATGAAPCLLEIQITSATRGLAGTALPDAAADAAGGLPVSDAGGLDLDAKLANTHEVTAARMGALTDIIDGGRLDLLVDAIKAKTDNLPASPAAVGSAMTLAADQAVNVTKIAGAAVDPTAAQVGVNVVNWKGAAAAAMTGDAFARLGAPAGASVSADVAAVKGDTAATLADTNELQTDLTNGGRLDLLVDGIKAKTDNLPALPAATGDIPTAAAVADQVWDEALAGHLGAGSTGAALNGAAAPTAAAVADAVWDELVADHAGVGSAGAALAAAGGSGDPWATALPGAYGAGTAGKILGDNLNAPVGTVDTIVDAIKAKTDNLPASPAAAGSQMDLVNAPNATAVTALQAGLMTAAGYTAPDNATITAISGYLDTEIASILTAVGTTLDGKLDAIAAICTEVRLARLDAAITSRSSHSAADVKTAVEGAGSHLALIKAKTDNLPASPAAVGSAMTLADDAITAAKFDETTAFPLQIADTGATQVARTGADSDTLETLSDQIDGVTGGATTHLTIEPQVEQ